MEMRTTNRSVVEDDAPYGVYVWRTPDGEVLGDSDGNLMNVFASKNDPKAIKAITEAARYYGHPEGSAEWWPGRRPITDEQYEEQLQRERLGLTPDPLDYGVFKDEMRSLRANGQ